MTKFGRLIVNTRPGNVEIYLDGQPVLDSSGRIAKSPTMILNVSEGIHNVTFSKDGYDNTTVMVNVQEGFDSDVKAILNTSQIRYPMMLSTKSNTNNTCSMLNAAIEDEFKAILEYSELLEIIEDKYTKDIKDILEDETEHYIELKKIAEEMQCSEISSQFPTKSIDPQITLAGSLSQPSPGWPTLPIPQVTYGHIVANTMPDGAEIYLDGRPLYDSIGNIVTTPATLLGIVTGIHTVTFRKQGYLDETVNVLIQNGLYSDAGAILKSKSELSSLSPYMNYDNNVNNINNISPYTESKWYMEPDYIQQYYLQPRQRGAVHFDTSPHGAIIMVDGQYITDPDTEEYIRTPSTVLLFEGRRDYVLKLENHYDVAGYVDVYAGSRVDIFKNMEPIPGSNIKSAYLLPYPYYPGYGDILIDSNPQGGYIYIDSYPLLDESGNAVLTPVKATGIMEGFHEVRIAKDGYYEKQLIVNVISNRDNRAFANLQPIYG